MATSSPYVGPRPFRLEDEGLFYGRDNETNELHSLLLANSAVLLYAQSGVGKTSLINAGLLPKLQSRGSLIFGPARVNSLIPEGIREEDIENRYLFSVLLSCEQAFLDRADLNLKLAHAAKEKVEQESALAKSQPPEIRQEKREALRQANTLVRQRQQEYERAKKERIPSTALANMSLNSYLQRQLNRQVDIAATNTAASTAFPILILDQFEELFTLYPELWRTRSLLFEALRDAQEGCPAILRPADILNTVELSGSLRNSQSPFIQCIKEEQAQVAYERASSHGQISQASQERTLGDIPENAGQLADYLNDVIQSADFYASWNDMEGVLWHEAQSLKSDSNKQTLDRPIVKSSIDYTLENRSLLEKLFPGCIVPRAAGNPQLRILFAMREDYIAELDPYLYLLPDRLATRFRLERLRRPAALEAIINPIHAADRNIERVTAEELVERLRQIRVKGTVTNDSSLFVPGEFIEPLHLQLVGDRIWRNLKPDEDTITSDHLLRYGDVDTALREFYEETLRQVLADQEARTSATTILLATVLPFGFSDSSAPVDEGRLRRWFQHSLIDEFGNRRKVYAGLKEAEGLSKTLARDLVKKYIIRQEWVDGAEIYELAHDRFIEPIRKSNKDYVAEADAKMHDAFEQKAAEWAERRRQGEKKIRLLSLAELKDFDDFQTRPGASFLGISNTLREYVLESKVGLEKANLRRMARFYAVIAAVVFLALFLALTQRREAIASAQDAKNQTKIAEEEAKRADKQAQIAKAEAKRARQQRYIAETARLEADRQRIIAFENYQDAQKQKAIAEDNAKKALAAKAFADQQRALANANALKASHQALIAKAEAKRARQQQHIAVAAVMEANRQKRIALQNFQEAQKQKAVAEENARKAQNEKTIADQQREIAQTQAKRADEQAKIAQANLEEAKKQTALAKAATAQAMLQRQRASENALLAVQAFLSPDNHLNFNQFMIGAMALQPLSAPNIVAPAQSNQIARISNAVDTFIQQKSPDILIYSPDGQRIFTTNGRDADLWSVQAIMQNAPRANAQENAWQKSIQAQQAKPGAQDAGLRTPDYGWKSIQHYRGMHSIPVRAAAFSPDNAWFVTAGKQGMLICDGIQGKRVKTINRHEEEPVEIVAISRRFHNNQGYVATAYGNGILTLWDVKSCAKKQIKQYSKGITALSFSPSEDILVCASGDGTVEGWHLSGAGGTPAVSSSFTLMEPIRSPYASTDSLADNTLPPIPAHEGPVTSIAFSKSGHRLASAGFDGFVRVWNLATERCIAEFDHQAEAVKFVTFTSDEDYLLTLTYGKTVRLWQVDSHKRLVDQPLANRLLADLYQLPD